MYGDILRAPPPRASGSNQEARGARWCCARLARRSWKELSKRLKGRGENLVLSSSRPGVTQKAELYDVKGQPLGASANTLQQQPP